MRVARFILSLVLIFASSSRLNSQQSTAAPQRDPQALAVLSKMFIVSGWSSTNLPANAVASGTATRYHGDTQDAVGITLKFRGYSEARMEVADPVSPTISVFHGEQASVSKTTGTQAIPAHSALSTPPVAMLFFCSFLNTSDPNRLFRFVGTETVGGQLTNRLEFDYIPSSDNPYSQVLRRAGHVTLWISTSSLLPIQVQYPRISNDNPTAVFLATRVYSDYRAINGIAVPFRQDEYLGNQLTHSLQLSTVNFNTGLSDADFAISVTPQ